MKKKNLYLYVSVAAAIIAVIALISVLLSSCSFSNLFNGENGIIKGTPSSSGEYADSVGVEAYDLSVYEQGSEAYAEALARVEEDWFPRPAVVIPKGPEGGEFPNAPMPIYDAYPGQETTTEEGETYEITRTWIGDIGVGTEVLLEGVVGQGEWCFVTGETIGGWSSSGWVWCYRLYIPDDTWVD